MQLMKKRIDLDALPVLYSRAFSEDSLREDFEIRGGEWGMEDGWLTGRNRGNFPGMIISRKDFFGPVMLDFEARTLLPSTHDINWMWSGSWNEETNTRALAYVAGLEGWWTGKVGFEKSPEYRLNCATQYLRFEPGRTYHIQSGSIGGHIFVVVDGALALEVTDPEPIDQTRFGRIGFEAYCSQIQIRDLKVCRVTWQDEDTVYTPEF